MDDIKAVLREAIDRAREAHDLDALAAFGQAITAIEEAEAEPVVAVEGDAIELAPIGIANPESQQRSLTQTEMRTIARAEIGDLKTQAERAKYTRPELAASLSQGAVALEELFSGLH